MLKAGEQAIGGQKVKMNSWSWWGILFDGKMLLGDPWTLVHRLVQEKDSEIRSMIPRAKAVKRGTSDGQARVGEEIPRYHFQGSTGPVTIEMKERREQLSHISRQLNAARIS